MAATMAATMAARRHAADWKRRESEAVAAAFVPLSFAPGEA